MLNFENFLNLPLIWYGLIATAFLVYALLDGFDLGMGILFPFAPSGTCRDQMMHSAAPFWDGNETWLVLGGGGLFAAFPLAYAVLMPAFYVPVIIMLLGLIFRGVSFEFRFKAERFRWVWDLFFHLGSLSAALMQGMMLGALIQGVAVEGRQFSGGLFDWVSPFSVMTGMVLMIGYSLLGAAWTILKTDGRTRAWARKVARILVWMLAAFMVLGAIALFMIHEKRHGAGLNPMAIYLIQPVLILLLILFVLLWRELAAGNRDQGPFFLTWGIFLISGIGIIISMWPWVVPFEITYPNAAATPCSQSFLLLGIGFLLPVILAYTGYCFWVFRGKASGKRHATY
ncbi:cytochrome d ubiquinol oxidase subunit II [Desulfosarcina sp. OttesenSCG-928-A07]|nr:cytochrome d ubiquinol oxidase subunit II [Desulfosarcina sp. OttesenSCG-928-G17]MDL2329809.1 cytochrome d ubiquinol oxidase subunit II [Desulfosarcina sp. OttesenSCG-928-A07]